MKLLTTYVQSIADEITSKDVHTSIHGMLRESVFVASMKYFKVKPDDEVSILEMITMTEMAIIDWQDVENVVNSHCSGEVQESFLRIMETLVNFRRRSAAIEATMSMQDFFQKRAPKHTDGKN